MQLLTVELRAKLVANRGTDNAVPVLKLYNPVGAATWLATEIDGMTLFGLADLGFQCPELGYFSLGEIARIHLPFGLRIERDASFKTGRTLSEWAEASRAHGSVAAAEAIFAGMGR
ncbi:DUF2958 domain-containing protein [Sphingomonas sp. S1-29]|uniref:DUF2958 domain-containing protein n=1 Tax=Sphingomonas sp. S1-29 TaxID=2991074 RepID=UPI00223F0372|nr:DUF2958 domain-containing protein [Sphingomonas sp. S1-29]UZK70774.1 DUF2958 domain-containing protein [Sphingomonas sp. S1-29]